MANYSRVIIAGNLTRDPEIRYLPSGQSVTNFSLAVSERYKQNGEVKEQVSYFDCVAFGKTGEILMENRGKGDPVLVDGRLRQRRWEDGQGNKRSKVEIIVDATRFLSGSRDDRSMNRAASGAAAEAPNEDFPF
jgi:single-strand DNA-binding protein